MFRPLGDQAVLAYFADEAGAAAFAAAARRSAPPGLIDVVQAYASVAAFFDPGRVRLAAATEQLRQLAGGSPEEGGSGARQAPLPPVIHHIPCCYELGPDLTRVARKTGLTADDVISRHAATEYTVYAIGFCPGFPYLGYLPAELSGLPRLEQPRLRVEPGSVGVTGRQTGIYTLPRPGGWNLIGRTPLVLVDVADGYFPLRTGDRVRFVRVDAAEFRRLEGRRL